MDKITKSESSALSFDEAISRCIALSSSLDNHDLTSLMELLCHFYDCDRACIYRYKQNNQMQVVAQWSVNGQYLEEDEFESKFDSTFWIKWTEHNHKNGLLFVDDKNSPENGHDINTLLSTLNLSNITAVTIQDYNRKIVGVVTLSNRHSTATLDQRLLCSVALVVAQEVTQNNEHDTLVHLHRDTLTGLYNRAAYAKRIDQILERKPKSMGVISANINGLRYINENAGIASGDTHIISAARRLEDHFGFEFYRMSGDEFVGIAPNVEEEAFEAQALSLYRLMREENNFDFSLGHTWGAGNIDISKLTHEADMLMYINKQQYYSSSNREFDAVNDTTLSDLLSYLANDEFMVYLQPQVRLNDGSLYGAEALIRRFDKKANQMVFPDRFIPLYEHKAVIRHVDMFVLESVCKLQQEWVEIGKFIPISVNFSRITLQEYGIVQSITEVCDRYNIPHNLVVIEVTERVGLIEDNVASCLVKQFKDQGFQLSLDDFGCAYSNIITLAQIEVDEVKIDKSLVDYILTNKKNHILVKNVLSMCNELEGTSTLAEGIETHDQGQSLYEMGCRLGQGYHYSRPIPVSEFITKYISQEDPS